MKYLIPTILILISGCATLKDFGYESNPRPWTTEEKVCAGASILATLGDWKTQTDLMDRGGHESLNITTGRYPSDERLALTMGAFEGLFIWIAHHFPYLRKLGLGTKTVVNTGLAIHNSKE